MTQIINMKKKIDMDGIDKCSKCIKNGGVVVFPTETVYGLGANAYDSYAVKKIFMAKERPADNPLILHICDKNMIDEIAKDINSIEQRIIDTFMPGPLTIILKKKDVIPDIVSSNLNTVGIRMPSNDIAIELIKRAGVPIAAPSANVSGRPSGTNIEDIKDELNDKVDYMIDYGPCKIGLESTVVKVINDEVVILRPGKISPKDFLEEGFKIRLDSHIYVNIKDNEVVESPGIRHRHYAPNTKSILVSSDDDEIYNKINYLIEINKGKKILVIGSNENKNKFSNICEYLSYGDKEDLDLVSKNIFSKLRLIDKYNVDICIIEGVKKEGIGIAIMNRLIRACGYNLVN